MLLSLTWSPCNGYISHEVQYQAWTEWSWYSGESDESKQNSSILWKNRIRVAVGGHMNGQAVESAVLVVFRSVEWAEESVRLVFRPRWFTQPSKNRQDPLQARNRKRRLVVLTWKWSSPPVLVLCPMDVVSAFRFHTAAAAAKRMRLFPLMR